MSAEGESGTRGGATSAARPFGLSIVLCCYNSRSRLPHTLEHLVQQRVVEGVRWEVLLVDNASTDGTAEVARELWPPWAPAQLRVVREERQGLTCARLRGIAESTYELICFVDDDNWVCPDWVAVATEVMASRPEVAACGGRSEAAFEVPPPAWFARVAGNYAVGTHGD
ncbi:MAG: glycosyltransferase family 2 protein, partial [Myxococcaceae bacterium]|nr:glycosyltransferase family 2 protein [Myxococcaceae bacterium]